MTVNAKLSKQHANGKLGTSPDNVRLDGAQIQIRPFRDADLQQVRTLFVKAMTKGGESVYLGCGPIHI